MHGQTARAMPHAMHDHITGMRSAAQASAGPQLRYMLRAAGSLKRSARGRAAKPASLAPAPSPNQVSTVSSRSGGPGEGCA